MDQFFNRRPEDVAVEILGKSLKIGSQEVIIGTVLVQNEGDNQHWIKAPLFTEPPADALAKRHRSGILLFLRTAPGTCIRIDSGNSANSPLKTPTSVCKALGIEPLLNTRGKMLTGDVSIQDNCITITWQN